MLKVFDLWGPSPSKGRDWSREHTGDKLLYWDWLQVTGIGYR